MWLYLLAITAGLMLGNAWPALSHSFEILLWPVLMLLLYVTFVQVPLLHLREAFSDHRFIAAVLTGNFIILPALAWTLVQWLPSDPALRLGILLVLLVPCTDWYYIHPTGRRQCAQGHCCGAINLVLQLLLLPIYLWLMVGADLSAALSLAGVGSALLVVLLPLIGAAVSERWIEVRAERAILRERLAWWPVPLLALVWFLIAGIQGGSVRDALDLLPVIVPLFALFLLLTALIAKGLAQLLMLPTDQGRTLAFSLGARNSFVVLPFALSLPSGWEVAAVVIVVQSLVELFGMVLYLWWVPCRLFRQAPRFTGAL